MVVITGDRNVGSVMEQSDWSILILTVKVTLSCNKENYYPIERFYSFFKFPQTFTSVSITR